MALFHVATITPTKEQLINEWAPSQPWGPTDGARLTPIGSYRFDDPDGRVGMECFLLRGSDGVFHVPLTYRDEPLSDERALITTMEHSVLGRRWVYDGLHDPLLPVMLCAVSMTGQGEALGMAMHEGRWYVAPSAVRIHGGGWTTERVPVDRLAIEDGAAEPVLMRNDGFELLVWRRPTAGARPAIGLVATWSGQDEPFVLAEVRRVAR